MANDDSATGAEDTSVVFTVAELLANDSDVDGDSLSITGVSNAVNGIATFYSDDGTGNPGIVFTPNAGYSGPASFDYTVSDGMITQTATVAITVEAEGASADPIVGGSSSETLNGSSANDIIYGNGGSDTIYGHEGDDLLVGGTGMDYLYGGAGDDTFVIEGTGQGADRIRGGDGFDQLIGSAGDDDFSLIGLYADAEYSLERIDGGAGYNRLLGTSSSNVLNFSQTELLNIDVILGGAGYDQITGSSGDDVIIGGTGGDDLYGGAGDDIFIVEGNDQGADKIKGNEGFDQILGGDADDTFSFTFFKPDYGVERVDGGLGVNLIKGTGARNILDFSESELLNIASIEGGAGIDDIFGDAGDNVIIGGSGDDLLKGGEGSDAYYFSQGDGRDIINNVDSSLAMEDRLIVTDIAHDNLWLSRSGDHLLIDVVGTDDRVKISNWFVDDLNQLETVEAASGVYLHRDQVDQLVAAMAAFDVPDGVGAVIPEDTRQQLEPTLTAVWQVA